MTNPTIPSRATRVTLFEDRAEVTRVAEVSFVKGTAFLAIEGVTAFADERSVEARIIATEGAEAPVARILSARVRYRIVAEKKLGREAIEAIEAEARAARDHIRELGEEIARAHSALERSRSLRKQWTLGVAEAPRRARAPETLARWREALRAIDASSAEALRRGGDARKARSDAELALQRAEARLREGLIEEPRHDAIIEVEIEAEAEGHAQIEVSYRTPAALWRPEHLIRLDGEELRAVSYATAWQRTGERWEDVELRFSTARPARAASPPLLTDDRLVARRKTSEERRHIHVDLREQAIATAGLDRGARAVDEMPGVDDGGEPVTLASKGRTTIPSNGRPIRVEVGSFSLRATVERVVFPEIAPVAHLRATATLEGAGPILAGPLRVARGASLVGRSKIGFIGRGEPFEVGLGPDDGVRVRREAREERDVTAVIGTQKIKRTVKIHLVNLSDEPRKVLVVERVPVSEIDDVEITIFEAGGFERDRDGLLRREVELPENGTMTLEIGYEIRASSKVVLPM